MRKLASALILGFVVSFVLPVQAEEKKEPVKVETKVVKTKVETKGEVKLVKKETPKVVVAKVLPAPKLVAPVKAKAEVPTTQPAIQPSIAQPVAQPAAAQEPTISEWWKVALRYSLELIFTILGIVATGFVTVLMKKYGFEAYTNKVETILERATGYAEQKSSQALKLTGKPLGAAEKLALALDIAIAEAKEYKLADKGKNWWENKLEGWLGASKLA